MFKCNNKYYMFKYTNNNHIAYYKFIITFNIDYQILQFLNIIY